MIAEVRSDAVSVNNTFGLERLGHRQDWKKGIGAAIANHFLSSPAASACAVEEAACCASTPCRQRKSIEHGSSTKRGKSWVRRNGGAQDGKTVAWSARAAQARLRAATRTRRHEVTDTRERRIGGCCATESRLQLEKGLSTGASPDTRRASRQPSIVGVQPQARAGERRGEASRPGTDGRVDAWCCRRRESRATFRPGRSLTAFIRDEFCRCRTSASPGTRVPELGRQQACGHNRRRRHRSDCVGTSPPRRSLGQVVRSAAMPPESAYRVAEWRPPRTFFLAGRA